MHASSWAKLQRAFLFSSMKTQWRQRGLLQQVALTGRSPKHHGHQRQSAQKAKEVQVASPASPAALRFQKLVKGLRSSFGLSRLPAAKSRRQLLGEHCILSAVPCCTPAMDWIELPRSETYDKRS